MQGWSTGSRNRHTLAGVPTRPAKKESHVCHAQRMGVKKPLSKKGAAAAPTDSRATKPVVLLGTWADCATSSISGEGRRQSTNVPTLSHQQGIQDIGSASGGCWRQRQVIDGVVQSRQHGDAGHAARCRA